MKVVARSTTPKMQPGQMVNQFGKYLYKHLDGAFKITNHPNMCDVYFMLLYQTPLEDRHIGRPEEKKMHEMNIDLNVTTYQNKIRVNVIEISPEERTLGCYVLNEEQLSNLNEALSIIYNKVTKRISKVYEDYDFIF